VHGLAVADAGFIDQQRIGSGGEVGRHDAHHGQTGAGEDDVVVADLVGDGDGHKFRQDEFPYVCRRIGNLIDKIHQLFH